MLEIFKLRKFFFFKLVFYEERWAFFKLFISGGIANVIKDPFRRTKRLRRFQHHFLRSMKNEQSFSFPRLEIENSCFLDEQSAYNVFNTIFEKYIRRAIIFISPPWNRKQLFSRITKRLQRFQHHLGISVFTPPKKRWLANIFQTKDFLINPGVSRST